MSRLTELKSALDAVVADINEGVATAVHVDGNNVEVKQDDWNRLRSLRDEADAIQEAISLEVYGDEVKSFYANIDALTKNPGTPASVRHAAGGMVQEIKSIGARFVESEEFKSLDGGRSGVTMRTPFTLTEPDIASASGYGQKDIYTGMVTPAAPRGFGSVQFDPMVPAPHRTMRVRDLFPAASTSANLIDYFRVMGFVQNGSTNAAAPVAERSGDNLTFAPKPHTILKFESAQAPVRTIAHWEAAHRNVLADEPQLRSTIDNELLYGLALSEDDQILNGDGTGENLLGVTRTPGIQVYTQAVGDWKSDALRRAATLSVLANFPGTGFVLHPSDWEDIELQKATGDGQYMLVTNVAIGATMTVWRQPVIESPAMTKGKFLTGAFGLGAQLYDREMANIRIAEQHADFFVRNAVVILAEERLALAVKRPESFVYGTFAATNPAV